jgi:tRNA (mo5U34)-methyltransferase
MHLAGVPARSDESMPRHYTAAEIDQLRSEMNTIPWFHRLDLGHGLHTPGRDIEAAAKIDFVKLPSDLKGHTVLDIGAWDGLFSFAAEQRGAARVLATDSFIWSGEGWASKAGFEFARRVLDSKVEDLDIDVMDLDPARIGTFDVTLFLGVLYHLRHPLLALEKVSSVTKEHLILSTWVDLLEIDRPAGAFYPLAEMGNDPTNWWGLNPPCVIAMLRDVGFSRVEIVSRLPGNPTTGTACPMAFHAHRH